MPPVISESFNTEGRGIGSVIAGTGTGLVSAEIIGIVIFGFSTITGGGLITEGFSSITGSSSIVVSGLRTVSAICSSASWKTARRDFFIS